MVAVKTYDSMLEFLDNWYKQQTSFSLLTSKKTKEDVIAQVGTLYNTLIERPVWISRDYIPITYVIKSLELTSFGNIDMYILDLRVDDIYDIGAYSNVELSSPPVIVIPKDIGDTFFKGEDVICLHSTVYGYVNPKDSSISHLNAVPDILASIVGFLDEDIVMEKYTQKCIQCTNEFIIN